MKKLVFRVLTAFLITGLTCSLFSFTSVYVKATVTKPKISITRADLLKGEILQLNLTNMKNTWECKWSSSDSSIATVKSGTVTAVGKGRVTINCKVTNKNTGSNITTLKTDIVVKTDSELDRAIKLGFVPKEIRSDFNATITFRQYCTMLSEMITLYDKTLTKDFKKAAKLALVSDAKMKRDDGMLALFYAAITMGTEQLTETDGSWGILSNKIGKPWDDFSWNYPCFPNHNKIYKWDGNDFSYMINAYFFSLVKSSRISGKTVFDYDKKGNTMHVNANFTREGAIRSVLRLYESTYEITKRTITKWDKQFLASVEERRMSILNSPTTIVKASTYVPGETYSGTAYYVSNTGDDNNDGKSPTTAWARLDKVNNVNLLSGDAVFFERGGIWRGELKCKEEVTYSAYGEGVKPCIYGSEENGNGSDKWKLWYKGDGGEKIWVFHRELTDCGGVVFNDGGSYASKVYAYWNGSKYVFYDDLDKSFDIVAALKSDLTFYSYYDMGEYSLPVYVYNIDTTGTLYLRCDEGNPGELYDSIEFQTSPNPHTGYNGIVNSAEWRTKKGYVVDNLCVMYGSFRGIATSQANNNIVQNCEVAWIGGATLDYTEEINMPGAGEGIGLEGDNNTAKNNYVHDCYDGGIISETQSNIGKDNSNLTIEDNLITYCMSGILISNHADIIDKDNMFTNITVKNNYILYTGYGWSSDKKLNSWMGNRYISSINFWEKPNANNGIYITNNVLYLSKGALVHLGMPDKYLPLFSGNTYVQNVHGMLAYWQYRSIVSAETVSDVIGDKAGIVILSN